MRISDWSSDVCSSDLIRGQGSAEVGLGLYPREAILLDADQEGIRRPRLFGQRAVGGRDQARKQIDHAGGAGNGAELARPRGAADALRHRRTETELVARHGRWQRVSVMWFAQVGRACWRERVVK